MKIRYLPSGRWYWMTVNRKYVFKFDSNTAYTFVGNQLLKWDLTEEDNNFDVEDCQQPNVVIG